MMTIDSHRKNMGIILSVDDFVLGEFVKSVGLDIARLCGGFSLCRRMLCNVTHSVFGGFCILFIFELVLNYQQKDWISAETLNKVQVRKAKKGPVTNSRTRTAKATAQEGYTEANRAVKNSGKTDNENLIEGLSKEIEDASAQGNLKQLYMI